jgi:acetylglutamate kinase
VSGVRVYKLGGPALEDPGLLPALAEELRRARGRVLVVHGGGR